jgi:signal transduction histidine kinase
MKQSSLEPGLLSVFRLFAGLRLGLLLLANVAQEVFQWQLVQPPFLLGVADSVLLFGYLSWPWLQRQLGRAFLPGALVIASVGTVIERYLQSFQRPVHLDIGEQVAPGGAWLLFLFVLPVLMDFLFVPLVMVAWQYKFRWVILFCLGTALLDLTLDTLSGDVGRPRSYFAAFTRTGSFVLVGYMVHRLVKGQREQRQALAQANARLAHYATTLEQLAVSRERNRLARELHDTLAHTLSAVAVQLEAVSALWDSDSKAAHAMLDQSLAATRTGLTETRRALQALRATPVEGMGLALAISNLAESVTARTGLALDLRLPEWVNDLSPEVEQSVYRVAQEALANITQHAGAGRVTLQLVQDDRRLTLTISDDGYGFDPDDVDSDYRFGLKGMREWAEAAGGTLEVESQPGRGTTVRLVVKENHDSRLNL